MKHGRKRRTSLNMSETPPFPPGNVVDVRSGTGLLTYAIHAGLARTSLPDAGRLQWEILADIHSLSDPP